MNPDQVLDLSLHHDVERSFSVELLVGTAHPSVTALRFGEKTAHSYMHAYQDSHPPAQLVVYALRMLNHAFPPMRPGAFRHSAEKRAGLGIVKLPAAKKIHNGARERGRFLVGYRGPDWRCGVRRVQRRMRNLGQAHFRILLGRSRIDIHPLFPIGKPNE